MLGVPSESIPVSIVCYIGVRNEDILTSILCLTTSEFIMRRAYCKSLTILHDGRLFSPRRFHQPRRARPDLAGSRRHLPGDAAVPLILLRARRRASLVRAHAAGARLHPPLLPHVPPSHRAHHLHWLHLQVARAQPHGVGLYVCDMCLLYRWVWRQMSIGLYVIFGGSKDTLGSTGSVNFAVCPIITSIPASSSSPSSLAPWSCVRYVSSLLVSTSIKMSIGLSVLCLVVMKIVWFSFTGKVFISPSVSV